MRHAHLLLEPEQLAPFVEFTPDGFVADADSLSLAMRTILRFVLAFCKAGREPEKSRSGRHAIFQNL